MYVHVTWLHCLGRVLVPGIPTVSGIPPVLCVRGPVSPSQPGGTELSVASERSTQRLNCDACCCALF